MPPKKKTTVTNEVIVPISVAVKTKIESALWQVRELCRKHHLQTLGKESLANQIYQDLLFIYHIPRLCREGILDIDIQRVGDDKLKEVSYASLLSLKEPELINASFKRLWKELQRCALEDLFYGRDFILFTIEKKKPGPYMALLLDLFKYFASIDLEGYDSNAGYTYFKKDLNKAIAKTFGQFYTPSTVTYSVVKLVDPKIGEKTLDPSCGSCSFLAEAANYIVKEEGVDIKTGFMDLYGTEVEPNIFAEGVMNMFINFGVLPDMKNRIREVDALLDMAKSEDQFDKIIANPPFGADASTFHEFYFKTELEPKGKRMVKKIVLNPEVKCQIPFTKTKESAILFFQFIVQKLKVGGKAGVVMSATILNDGFKDMIEWFLNCCSLEKVVINPAGTFKEQGTGIETFSFIFRKGKPTTTVEIVMLGAEDDTVRTLTLEQIKEAGWKLQLKEEVKEDIVNTEVFPMVKLGDIIQRVSGKKLTLDEAVDGDIPLYSASVKIHRHNEAYYDASESIIQACIGSNLEECIHFTSFPFATTGNLWILRKKSDNILMKYLHYVLRLSTIILKVCSDHTRPIASFSPYAELQIPLPPLPIQQEIVANLDRIFTDPQDMKDCLAFTDKAMDLMLKDPTGKQLEDVLGGLRLKRAYLTDAASVKSQMAAVVRSVGVRGFERKKLGDLLEIEGGDYITKSSETTGQYPVYGGGAASYHINRFNREPTCVINKDGMSASCVQMVNKRFFLNHHGWTLKLKSADLVEKFLHWQLYYRSDEIFTLATGSCQKGLNQKEFTQFMIYIPPLPIQHEVLAILNEMEAELAILEEMAAKAEQRAKFILDGYLTSAE